MFKYIILSLLLLSVLQAEKDYTDDVKALKAAIEDKNGPHYHFAYNKLAFLSDTYGPRMWGSAPLEKVINQMKNMADSEGFDNVRIEEITGFTGWVRGAEELILLSPRTVPTKLNLIGLGDTRSGSASGNAIVFRNVAEMNEKNASIKGKIVVFNQPWTNYGESVEFRALGAKYAADFGAIGMLVRSVASTSIYSVHGGGQFQNPSRIPCAAITVEDAEMFQRMQNRGQTITLKLTLNHTDVPDRKSGNIIFEIKGSTKPDEILLMGGHIDSWDTGSQTGANDDGGGFITCYSAMRLLKKSGLTPKRTLRFIAWSGEEWKNDKNGAHNYFNRHKDEKHVVAFENDLGSTKLYGFGYLRKDSTVGKQIVSGIATKYLGILNATTVTTPQETGVDTEPLGDIGIPTMINLIEDSPSHDYYFRYHHSAGDTMSIMNPDDMDSNVVGIAAMFYILADLDDTIPL